MPTQVSLRALVLGAAMLAATSHVVAAQSNPTPPDLSAVRSDLRRLLAAQETYFTDHNAYSNSLAGLNVTLSDGVTIKFVESGPMAYSASGTLAGKAGVSCVYFVGHVAAIPRTAQGVAAKAEGGVLCDGDPPAEPAGKQPR